MPNFQTQTAYERSPVSGITREGRALVVCGGSSYWSIYEVKSTVNSGLYSRKDSHYCN